MGGARCTCVCLTGKRDTLSATVKGELVWRGAQEQAVHRAPCLVCNTQTFGALLRSGFSAGIRQLIALDTCVAS